MSCGLYGKLPMKRDFISVSTPHAFLERWEPWLQGGIAASRIALGAQWQDIFLRAPIWRFWLGAEICGRPAMGSFMPSVDGVGRFFPLTAFACGEAGSAFPAPQSDPQAAWFAEVEAMLLDALDEDAAYDRILETLSNLPSPASVRTPAAEATIRDLFSATLVTADTADSLEAAFASLLAERERRQQAAGCFFWTIGGEDFPPAALFCTGLPDPNVLTTFLSGQFSPLPLMEIRA
ncbi:MAG TPA: type VI secretion system-associated protein TagF [Reyranella sp.]|nr:type VI secretion system-associated protein TagF [Reyranella sp.]